MQDYNVARPEMLPSSIPLSSSNMSNHSQTGMCIRHGKIRSLRNLEYDEQKKGYVCMNAEMCQGSVLPNWEAAALAPALLRKDTPGSLCQPLPCDSLAVFDPPLAVFPSGAGGDGNVSAPASPPAQPGSFPCPACARECISASSLKRHQDRHCSFSPPPYPCLTDCAPPGMPSLQQRSHGGDGSGREDGSVGGGGSGSSEGSDKEDGGGSGGDNRRAGGGNSAQQSSSLTSPSNFDETVELSGLQTSLASFTTSRQVVFLAAGEDVAVAKKVAAETTLAVQAAQDAAAAKKTIKEEYDQLESEKKSAVEKEDYANASQIQNAQEVCAQKLAEAMKKAEQANATQATQEYRLLQQLAVECLQRRPLFLEALIELINGRPESDSLRIFDVRGKEPHLSRSWMKSFVRSCEYLTIRRAGEPFPNQVVLVKPLAAAAAANMTICIPAGSARQAQKVARKAEKCVRREAFSVLQTGLVKLLGALEPRDGDARSALFACVQQISQSILPEAQLTVFGSTGCNLHAHGADLDLTLLPLTKTKVDHVQQQQLVQQLAWAVQSHSAEARLVEAVISARVPIVRLVLASQLQADVSIGNELAIQKTSLLAAYARQDARVRPLCLLVKNWAKLHNLNRPFDHTLSSYAWTLLVIHFLQTCEPAVVPCLSADTLDVQQPLSAEVRKPLPPLPKGAERGDLAHLLLGFFCRFGPTATFPSLSVRLGRVLDHRLPCAAQLSPNIFSIEDPVSPAEDLGRTLNASTQELLLRKLREAHGLLSSYPTHWCLGSTSPP